MKHHNRQLALGCVAALLSMTQVQALDVNVNSASGIQSAIDTVAAAGGGNVNIAGGAYTITSTIKLKSQVTVAGAGNPATTLNASGNFDVFQQSAEGLSNVTIKNLKIVGKHDPNCHGIIVESLGTYHTNVNLTNVQIRDCGMGSHLKRVNGGAVSSCNIHTNGTYSGTLGFQNLYVRNVDNYTVVGTSMSYCSTSSGCHIGGVCNTVDFRSNTLNNNFQYGINVTDTPTNLMIRYNTCNYNNEYGIVAWSGSGSIYQNTALGNGTAGYLIYGSYSQSGNQ